MGRRDESYRATVVRLATAQKVAARSAPAYSRFVNRRLGRLLAAWAYRAGLSPNAVTAVSAGFTFSAVVLLAVLPPTWWLGITVALLLVLGYAFDSADGQVARLTGTGSAAGEWLDHIVDATKVVTLPLALLVGLYRAEAVSPSWLLVPLANAVVSSVLFFAMILTEQLRRAAGVRSQAETAGRVPWLRSLLVIPTDYGVLCLLFALYGATTLFVAAYAVITLLTAAFLLLAAAKWFREIAALGSRDDVAL
ncbi:CDP-alcohol phosphatidyltransferase family protein [Cellulosimicrobium cellulans]|uniref:CDP-alcohol phosphatidyltransferase family protein n=1 Tax=Cellulosimicrobium cellulans TaxID=1710 RepID=UPI0005B8635C|nr:CDP-alcohol phosphatidyltransferase family protein [Cellulosimicrobium cellulans]